MMRLMTAGGSTGIYRHMSDVEDFAEMVRDIQETFSRIDLVDVRLEIFMHNETVTGSYRVLPEVARISNTPAVVTRGIYDGKLTIYLDVTGSIDNTSATITGTINGAKVTWAPDVNPLSDDQQADCIRVTAARLAIEGHTSEAIELLTQVGEDGVAETLAEAHTHRDRRTNGDRCRRAFRDKRFIGAGLKPTGPSHCVLNVLAILVEDPAVVISLPSGVYKRGGILKEDPRVVNSPLGRTLEVVGYTGKEDRFNFSVTCKRDVRVLPADDKGNIIDGEPKAAVVHRTYNLIRDGELVMNEILASLSEVSFAKLQEAGVIAADETYKPGKSYTLCLGGMKMVSSAWARPGSLSLVETLREIEELKLEQTALNKRIKALGRAPVPEFEGNVYRDKPQVVKGAQVECYRAPFMELRLMKYKSSRDYAAEVKLLDIDAAIARVKQVRRDLKRLRFRTREIAFACEVTGWKSVDWGTPTTTHRTEVPKDEYECKFGEQTVKRVTWEADVEYS